jgi:hypothetical protein
MPPAKEPHVLGSREHSLMFPGERLPRGATLLADNRDNTGAFEIVPCP